MLFIDNKTLSTQGQNISEDKFDTIANKMRSSTYQIEHEGNGQHPVSTSSSSNDIMPNMITDAPTTMIREGHSPPHTINIVLYKGIHSFWWMNLVSVQRNSLAPSIHTNMVICKDIIFVGTTGNGQNLKSSCKLWQISNKKAIRCTNSLQTSRQHRHHQSRQCWWTSSRTQMFTSHKRVGSD